MRFVLFTSENGDDVAVALHRITMVAQRKHDGKTYLVLAPARAVVVEEPFSDVLRLLQQKTGRECGCAYGAPCSK